MSLLDPKTLEVPCLLTMSNRLGFRTSSCLNKQDNTKFFYLAQFDIEQMKFTVKRVANPLSTADISYLENHGIEGFDASDAPRKIEKQDNFFQKYAKATAENDFTAMAQAFLELDDYMAHPKDGSDRYEALPDEYLSAEKHLLGAFHIRKYLIEHGSIAGRVNPATRKSTVYMLGDLANDAFSPIILTDIIPQEWHYATRRINAMTPPAYIHLRTPYDSYALGDTDSWENVEAVKPLRLDIKQVIAEAQMKAQNMAAMDAIKNNAEAVTTHMPAKSRLSATEQAYLMEALLTEPGDITVNAPKWLKIMKKEQGFTLSPADLKDRNGPLGVLFYQAIERGKIKYGFEALPALLNHFNEHGYYTTMRDIESTKLRGKTLIDYMRAAATQGISAPYDVVNSPLTRALRP